MISLTLVTDSRKYFQKIPKMSKWSFQLLAMVVTEEVTDHKTSLAKVSERAHSRAKNYRGICSASKHSLNETKKNPQKISTACFALT
jgi:hypothetical protein